MEVLLIKRSNGYIGGTWQMVSGSLEHGETGVDAALRELQEETGITPKLFYSANHLQQFYEVGQNCVNLVPVFVAFVDSDCEIQLSSEHTDYMWVSFDRVGDYVAFPDQADSARYIYENFVLKEPLSFLRIPADKSKQDGAGQLATSFESELEDNSKPKPETEGCSQ